MITWLDDLGLINVSLILQLGLVSKSNHAVESKNNSNTSEENMIFYYFYFELVRFTILY